MGRSWIPSSSHRTAQPPQRKMLQTCPDLPRLASEVGNLKKAVACTEMLARLGGVPHALESDPGGDVHVRGIGDGEMAVARNPKKENARVTA